MKKLNVILLLLLSALHLTGKAQTTTTEHNRIIISGNVTDSISRKPVAFATVSIEPEGYAGTPLGQVTDNNGYFRIEVPQSKAYLLKTSFVGMKPGTHRYLLKAGEQMLEVGQLLMQPDDKILDDVKVVHRRALVKVEIDRIAYAMQEDKDAAGKDLLEMLRKVPLVTVDGQGNIQVKGSSNFRVFLNGKPSPMFNKDPQEIIRSIPASTIRRVEVITDPGVKYSAEGIGAILNIVTATATGDGITGRIGLSGGIPEQFGTSLYLATKQGKFGATLNANGYTGKNSGSQTESIVYENGTRAFSSTPFSQRYTGAYGNLLLSYEIDSLNLLTINGAFGPSKINFQSDSYTERIPNAGAAELTNSTLSTRIFHGNIEAGLDYQHSTRCPDELLTLSYRFSYNPFNVSSNQQFTGSAGNHLERTRSVSTLNEQTAQIDYIRPFGKLHSIEAGAKFIRRASMADPSYDLFNPVTGTWEKGSSVADNISQSKFNHAYNIWAGYTTYTFRRNRYSLKGGFRLEGGKLSATYDKVPEANFSRNFFDWVPDFSAEYRITDMQQMKFNYNFRISRPSITQLNPFVMKTAPYSAQKGNSRLDAERRHSFSLDYNLFSPKFVLNASAGFGFTNNSIQPYSYDSLGTVYATSRNIGKTYAPSLNLYSAWTLSALISIYVNGSVTYNMDRAPALNLSTNGVECNIYLGSQISLPKDWNISLGAGYWGAGRRLQQTTGGNVFESLSVSKNFFNKRFTVGLGLNNLAHKNMTWRTTMYGKGLVSEKSYTARARSIRLNISYSFGSLKQQVKRTRRTIVNDDLIKQSSGNSGGKNE